ncbi:hypothetical protein [Mycolicibacterium llatzerense]|uniref:hypothetical protein n=1 Tax=Mycolicibacterium llatzerense TaxID=280871 RepID=UPI0021B5B471|nr:hypothetical protein [Mycolicibacterium llatzerense]MCT7369410.1 hypothetical protein [Mycolicibacterium llatzerense]
MSRLQQLPIMDRLFCGATIQRVGVQPDMSHVLVNDQVTRELFEYLAGFKRVKLSDIPPAPSKGKSFDVRKEFGHLMLPFPRVWVEWNNFRGNRAGIPDVWIAAMCIHQTEIDQFSRIWFGVDNASEILGHFESASWIALPLYLVAGQVMSTPVMLAVDLDDSGVLHGVRGVDGGDILGLGALRGDSSKVTAELCDVFWEALLCIGWMNCRNVEVKQHDRSKNVAGSVRKRARNIAKSLDFHTIHLPGVEYDSDGNVTGSSQDRRLHRVRGHFKTFTGEAPLLGQHVGTYWWGWQVRGNRDNGVVVSDYQVGAPS